jgi:hypothetical protein
MLRDIFSLAGLIAFIAGVLLSGWVMSLVGKGRAQVGG